MLLNQRTILWGSSDIMRMTTNHWRKISQINGDYTHKKKNRQKKKLIIKQPIIPPIVCFQSFS